jgi:hypothetical protein
MATSSKIFFQSIIVVTLCLINSLAIAQNEVARERSSLKGIQNISFTVNLETAVSLTKKGKLEATALKEMGEQTLLDRGITLIPDNKIQRSDEVPFLYLHVNALDAGQGLVPFSITLYLYQPVKLVLNQDMQTSSITWESGSVGIVSYDQMDLINNAAQDLLDEFISDYHKINSTN